jgi:hypothetical protein
VIARLPAGKWAHTNSADANFELADGLRQFLQNGCTLYWPTPPATKPTDTPYEPEPAELLPLVESAFADLEQARRSLAIENEETLCNRYPGMAISYDRISRLLSDAQEVAS